MPDATRIARARILNNYQLWVNKHQNVQQQYQRLYSIVLPPADDTGNNILNDIAASAVALQGLIQDAITAGVQLRCLGGTWSLSAAAATSGWLLDTLSMNLYWTIGKSEVDAQYTKDNEGLFFFQGGVTVQDVNTYVESYDRALITSGASNGQTIAGAIATGTHGSAFKYGSMTEYLVGLYLVTGPDKIIYLERASYPVVSDSFVAAIGAELMRDDALFNAALVSFGSMGIIAGIMIETESIYTLAVRRYMLDLDDNLRAAMNTMDLSSIGINSNDPELKHFEVTFNPHSAAQGYARTMYVKPYPAGYTAPPQVNGELGPGQGLLEVIGKLNGDGPPALVAATLALLLKQSLALTPDPPPAPTTPGDTFTLTTLRGKAMSMELGISVADSSRVLDLILGLTPEIDVYAGVVSYRWIGQTTATLGWSKFATTATIEFNAANNQRTLDFYNRLWSELTNAGIPYTLHWGQMNNFTPDIVRSMYGSAVNSWIANRGQLLSADCCKVFSNAFLESTGLG